MSLCLTKEVLEEREVLHMTLEGLNEQIKLGLDKIEEMRQEELVLQKHEKDIEVNKNFEFKVRVTKPHYVNLEGTGQHTTTCVPCHCTCHKECKIADDERKKKCWAMNRDGKCRICPRKCNWSEHKNLPYVIEYKVVLETRTLETLKKKYHKAVQNKASTKQMITSLDQALQEVHVQVLNMIKKAQQSVRRLDEIALKPNPLTEVQYIEVLIESEKRTANPGWNQRISYYEEAKRQAVMLSKVTDEKESEKLIEQLSQQGMDVSRVEKETRNKLGKMKLDEDQSQKWYSRFKFW